MCNIKNIIQSVIGPYSSLELVYNLKSFFNGIGCNNIYYHELDNNISDFRYSFLLNNTLPTALHYLELEKSPDHSLIQLQ